MEFPETWASLLLVDAPGDLVAFAARLFRECEVEASPTDLGWLQLPGGFLAKLERAAYPADLFEHAGAHVRPERFGAAVLHVSGGGYEPDNLGFRLQGELAALGREPRKTSRFVKVERFTELVRKLLPLAHGCVLPMSGFRWVPAAEWPATSGAGEVFGNFVTLANCLGFLHTRGMRYFALPDVALAMPAEADQAAFDACVRRAFDCAFEIAWQGFLPNAPATLTAFVDRNVAPFEVQPLSSASLWVSTSADTEAAREEWLVRCHVGASLKQSYVTDEPDARRKDVKVAAFADGAGGRVYATCGLYRHSSPPAELLAFAPRFAPLVAKALALAVDVFLAGGKPVRAYDRLVMTDLEPRGLAGVVLWPCGHVNVQDGQVETWDALPFTPEELKAFRAGGQQEWIDRMLAENAFDRLHQRWSLLA